MTSLLKIGGGFQFTKKRFLSRNVSLTSLSNDVLNVGVMLELTLVINQILYFSDKMVLLWLEIRPLSPNKYSYNLLDNGSNNFVSWTFLDNYRTSTFV